MSEWMSVEDKLPKDGECVDIWIKLPDGDEGRMENYFYDKDCKKYWRWSGVDFDKKLHLDPLFITHWMPLPPPPKA